MPHIKPPKSPHPLLLRLPILHPLPFSPLLLLLLLLPLRLPLEPPPLLPLLETETGEGWRRGKLSGLHTVSVTMLDVSEGSKGGIRGGSRDSGGTGRSAGENTGGSGEAGADGGARLGRARRRGAGAALGCRGSNNGREARPRGFTGLRRRTADATRECLGQNAVYGTKRQLPSFGNIVAKSSAGDSTGGRGGAVLSLPLL